MKLKLNVLERITMGNLIPKEENYLTYKLIATLRKDLIFSEAEEKKAGIRPIGDKIYWDDINVSKDIEIPDVILAMLVEKLKQIEKDKKICDDNCSLYEKLVLNKT